MASPRTPLRQPAQEWSTCSQPRSPSIPAGQRAPVDGDETEHDSDAWGEWSGEGKAVKVKTEPVDDHGDDAQHNWGASWAASSWTPWWEQSNSTWSPGDWAAAPFSASEHGGKAVRSLLATMGTLYEKAKKDNPEKFNNQNHEQNIWDQQTAKAWASGDLNLNDALGQRFRRLMKNDDEYASAKSREEKKKFRKKWLEGEYQKTVARRTRLQEEEDEDILAGSYEPLDVIVEKEGGNGNPANITAAEEYAKEAMSRGSKWVRWNSWTKRLEFLYLKMGCKKTLRNKWSVEKVETTEVKDEVAVPEVPAAKKQKKNELPAKDVGKTPKPKAKQKAEGGGKSPLQINMQKAAKLKQSYNQATAGCDELVTNLDKEGCPDWLKAMIRELDEAKVALKKKVSESAFAGAWMMRDAKDVRKEWGDEETSAEAKKLAEWLPEAIANLEDKRGKVLSHINIG